MNSSFRSLRLINSPNKKRNISFRFRSVCLSFHCYLRFRVFSSWSAVLFFAPQFRYPSVVRLLFQRHYDRKVFARVHWRFQGQCRTLFSFGDWNFCGQFRRYRERQHAFGRCFLSHYVSTMFHFCVQ